MAPKSLSKEFASTKNLDDFIDADALTAEKEKERVRIFTEQNKD